VSVQLNPRGAACLLIFVLAASARPAGQGGASSSIQALLDRYQKGDFAAISQLATATDSTQLQSSFIEAASTWIARDPSDIINRRLVATAFAIELAHARLAVDNPTLIVLLEWAKKEWRKGAPSAAERVWTRAAFALLERGGRVSPERARGRDAMSNILRSAGRIPWRDAFIADAAGRFPDDARLQLAKLLFVGGAIKSASGLEPLTGDPEIGPDVLLQIAMYAYRDSRQGDKRFDEVRRLADQAARRAVEPWTIYLAHFLAGLSNARQGHAQDAIREYLAALDAVPRAQSASLALAEVLLRGTQADTDAAVALVTRSLAEQPDGEDPWRLFEYGEYVRWPALIADVRKAIH
jgi:hypothetical protein